MDPTLATGRWPLARALLAAGALIAAAPAARADPPTFFACIGDGCEYADAAPSSAACAAAATNPDTFHKAFARGCIAQRDFSHRAPARVDDCAAGGERCAKRRDAALGNALDPVRLPTVEVVAELEPDDAPSPTLERRFAAALVQGNPEMAGGKIRHGAYHALGMYWGAEPLSFLYLNLRYGLFE